jgi:cytochrome c oxidase cbb3-type subunit 3
MTRKRRLVPPGILALAAAATGAPAAILLPAAAQTTIGGDTQPESSKPPGAGSSSVEFVSPMHSMGKGAGEENALDQFAAANADTMLKVPVSGLYPGGVSIGPDMPNPAANDPDAANRGMRDFTDLNCVGCHAPNGGGGMGPSLSNRVFIYGSKPAQIYLSIVQGRPHGMPSWGGRLPDSVVWDLVAYVQQISQAPESEWGTTVSPTSPKIEQVPAEYQVSTHPWDSTQPFGYGQNPEGRKQ